jgi:hypothetical protein
MALNDIGEILVKSSAMWVIGLYDGFGSCQYLLKSTNLAVDTQCGKEEPAARPRGVRGGSATAEVVWRGITNPRAEAP